MSPVKDFPYRAAATLAIKLMSERPSLDAAHAIHIAWRSYELCDPRTFHLVLYDEEVRRAIGRIQSGNEPLVEPPPRVMQQARELMG